MKTMTEWRAEFAAHGKLDPAATMKVLKLEKTFQGMVEDIFDLCPESDDRKAGLEMLLLCKWIFTHSVTHPDAPMKPEKKSAKEKES